MIVALIDSGLGSVPTAAYLRRLRPDLDLILSMDPEHAPWGPKDPDWVTEQVVTTARRAVARGAEVVVIPCNTASVTSLDDVRADLGPDVPVVGTVPAVKPAARECATFAVWATAATTASAYQANLIAEFASGSRVESIACHGLADAIDRGDDAAVDHAIAAAAAATGPDVEGVVLGCTHYPLVADRIAARLPAHVALYDSAPAVAAQTVRRIDALGRDDTAGSGTLEVFLSGRPGRLPDAATRFGIGRELGGVPYAPDSAPA